MSADTLRAEDLMVGDLVEIVGGKQEKFMHPHFQVVTVPKLDYIEAERLFVAPIPISEDWLERNGFKSKSSYIGTDYELNEYTSVIWVKTRKEFVLEHGIYDTDTPEGVHVSVKYVYELQHLFRALKLEKDFIA